MTPLEHLDEFFDDMEMHPEYIFIGVIVVVICGYVLGVVIS
jgi:hypothetical protein